jgi:hypothetical protein
MNIEDRRIKIAVILVVILVVIVGFTAYYFYPKDEYVMEMVKPSRPSVEKIEEISEFNKKKIPTSLKVEFKEKKTEEEKQIIERGNVLFTETDSSGKYIIQLVNAIDINFKNNDNSRNITISGQIEDNSEKTEFSISIGEEYINYLSDLRIRIVDSTNKERVIETASYFLGALDLDSSYKIKLNVIGDTLDGEIISSEKLSKDILKEIGNTKENIVNTEEEESKKEN